MSDPVREYLRDKGCAEHVVKGGFGGLVRDWESTVASIVRGYEFGLDDYLNDLDGRQLISEVMEIADPPSRLKYGERVRLVDEHREALDQPLNACGVTLPRDTDGRQIKLWYFSVPQTTPGVVDNLNTDRASNLRSYACSSSRRSSPSKNKSCILRVLLSGKPASRTILKRASNRLSGDTSTPGATSIWINSCPL